MSSLDGDNHIYLHEVGHTFALDGKLNLTVGALGLSSERTH